MLVDSNIEIQNQILRVTVSINGAPLSLHYSSDRVRGRFAAYSLEIPLSEEHIPVGLKKITLELYVAGQRFTKDFPPLPQQSYLFTWDGKDHLGLPVQGKQEAKIRIGYVYRAFYPRPEVTQWKESALPVGAWEAHALGLHGWSLNIHHAYDPVGGVLYLGDSTRQTKLEIGPYDQKNKNDAGWQNGRETIVAAEDGNELYIFDISGRHVRTLHPLTGGILYRFRYDTAGRLEVVEDGNGNITRIEHKAPGSSSQIIAPYGHQTTLVANRDGYLSTVANDAGEKAQFMYLRDGLLEKITDANGNNYHFTYDELGRLTKKQDPTTAVTALASKRDSNSSLIAVISPLGRESTYLVEDLTAGGERRVTKCCGGSELVELDSPDKTRTTTYPNGMVIKSEERARERSGIQEQLSQILTLTTPAGLTCMVTLDWSAIWEDKSPAVRAVNSVLSINGRMYRTAYDAGACTFTDNTPVGRQSRLTTDALGRIIHFQAGDLLPFNFSYDERGRLIWLGQGSGPDARTIDFSYNESGLLDTITDCLNRTVRFTRDVVGRVIEQRMPDGTVTEIRYDPNGNVISIKPAERTAHLFRYTAVDSLSAYVPPKLGNEKNQTLYQYNADQQLTTVSRADDECIDLLYDSAHRLSTVNFSRGKIVYGYQTYTDTVTSITAPSEIDLSFAYDGSLLTSTSLNGPVNGQVSRVYDNNLRIASLSVNGATFNLEYDGDGLLTRVGDLRLERDQPNGFVVGTRLGRIKDEWGYNAFGELMRYSAAFDGALIYANQFTRDRVGRIIEKRETINATTETFTYTYDIVGRLTQVKNNDTTTAIYAYDANSNRISRSKGSTAYIYDGQDRLTTLCSESDTQTFRYTPSGELQSKIATTGIAKYHYDGLGNLVQVVLPDGTLIDYLIDGLNRRVGKKINGALVQGFLYTDGLKPAAELDGRNKIIARFFYASRFNAPDYIEKNGSSYRVIADHLGSPRLVVDARGGAIAQQIDYDEFGNVLLDTNPGFQPFGFAGGLYDCHTQLLRFGTRDYDSHTGRWTSKDPILFLGGSLNLYGYALNDPVNVIDPDGRQWTELDQYGLSPIGLESVLNRATYQYLIPTRIGQLVDNFRKLQKQREVLDQDWAKKLCMLRNVKQRNAEWIKVRDKRESIYDANISIVRELWDLHFLYTVLGEGLDMGGENLTPSTELFSNDVAIIMGKKKP